MPTPSYAPSKYTPSKPDWWSTIADDWKRNRNIVIDPYDDAERVTTKQPSQDDARDAKKIADRLLEFQRAFENESVLRLPPPDWHFMASEFEWNGTHARVSYAKIFPKLPPDGVANLYCIAIFSDKTGIKKTFALNETAETVLPLGEPSVKSLVYLAHTEDDFRICIFDIPNNVSVPNPK